jgi:hypothetical protein
MADIVVALAAVNLAVTHAASVSPCAANQPTRVFSPFFGPNLLPQDSYPLSYGARNSAFYPWLRLGLGGARSA